MNTKYGETSFWLWLCPRYGKFGGASWTGGKFVNTYEEEQKQYFIHSDDDMDELFKLHDIDFTVSIRYNGIFNKISGMLYANMFLLWGLLVLPLIHIKWNNPPNNVLYSYLYRCLAIIGMLLFNLGLGICYPVAKLYSVWKKESIE